MDNVTISSLIQNRQQTRNGIYCDIGTALEAVPTADLVRFFVEVTMNGSDLLLRDYVEKQIIGGEINKLRHSCG